MKKKIIFGLAILMAIGGMAFAWKCSGCGNNYGGNNAKTLCNSCQAKADAEAKAREERRAANEYQAKKNSIGKENAQYCENQGENESECVDDIYNFLNKKN